VTTPGRAGTGSSRPGEGAHLAEGWPVILSSLAQAVSMFTVHLEEASCAQLVEWPKRHTRGIPEPHGAILMAAARANTTVTPRRPAHPFIHSSNSHCEHLLHMPNTSQNPTACTNEHLLYRTNRQYHLLCAKLHL
jgi:hypothetical protein